MQLGKLFRSDSQKTQSEIDNVENHGIIDALMKSQAFISFKPDGTIIKANENFLNALGYRLEEVSGQHHAIFCEPDYVKSDEYKEFWAHLASGNFHSDEFKRITKDGKAIHIQATYNPIKDETGKVIKVVKFATDITARVANVEALASALQEMSQGNLTVSLDSPFEPDFERLRNDFNQALRAVEDAVAAAKAGAGAISQGTTEIAHASDDLARRTEGQAARLSETSTAFGEIAEAVKQTAEAASSAQEIISSAHSNAEQNGIVMDEAVDAMRSIESSSNEIADIIGVIDEIAYQTNLLALNAGVEAARAGDAGRGFAVVASEVRALAQRSADAAKQIKNLITVSGDRVGQGVDRVEKAGEALKSIIEGMTEVTSKSGEIADAAREQSDGLQRVGELVSQMDQITQQNAAMVEETTAATRSLADKTQELAQVVNHFKTGQTRQVPAESKQMSVAA